MTEKRLSLQKIVELQKFLIAFQEIERVVHIKTSAGHVKENDIEHSYALAIVGWYLCESIPRLNRDLVIRYALVHDIVEIYAGDTYAFADKKSLEGKSQREHQALKRIKKEWADFPAMLDSITNYEKRSDEESKFIYALDKIMPIVLNMISGGYTWHEEKITIQQLHEIKKNKVAIFPEIGQLYFDEIFSILSDNPAFFS
jgi:putative hydrolase of HD superfamily